ncbi:hypothetical protein NC653_033113 [Populus alba x Populus x berolinensis]|uniref:Uncharacterized protein n=1 Tax=Populus alba x Populus x berolinensis TaxID=444605 RepID=A0AAD6LSV6_9ROSI|nr:hypothetical protein NC653_032020 [Populus alba x Populus x berolinensis]KAJ6972709.1 hypothetical protein NC653_033113 [Populus alba x Populus x berolinensis]
MQRLPSSQHITTHKLTKRWNGEAISKKNAATDLEAGRELRSNSYKSTSVQKNGCRSMINISINNNDPAIRASAFARTFSLQEVKTQLSRVSSTA